MTLHRNLLVCLLSMTLLLGGCATYDRLMGNHADEQNTAEGGVVQPINTESASLTASQLQTVWGVDVDHRRPKTPYGFSRPTLAGDLIVLAGQDRYVHIYDMQGKELNRIPLQASSDSEALALSDKLVVLGDAQGLLYGIDVAAGAILWQRQLSSVMLGHPVRLEDDMLVQTGDNSIYRISAKGEKLWSFSSAQAGLSMHISPSPLVAGDVFYAVMSNGDAVALRSDSGDLLWRRQLLLDNDAVVLSELKAPLADPILVGNVLLVSFYQGDLIALSAIDGQQLWQRNFSLKSTPLEYQGRLFVATADHAVLELDPANGTTLWKRDLDAGELVGPVLAQGRLVVADDQGRVFALSLDGQVTGQLTLPGRVDRSPVAASGGVLLRNNLGGLYLIR
jgi:outer membrane protein assembly factor BamB